MKIYTEFTWSGLLHKGHIISQEPSSIQGQKTVIKCIDGTDFTIYGKYEVGNCGPFKVQLIGNDEEFALADYPIDDDYNSASEIEASLYHDECGDR